MLLAAWSSVTGSSGRPASGTRGASVSPLPISISGVFLNRSPLLSACRTEHPLVHPRTRVLLPLTFR